MSIIAYIVLKFPLLQEEAHGTYRDDLRDGARNVVFKIEQVRGLGILVTIHSLEIPLLVKEVP
jgi:hypothetical protein